MIFKITPVSSSILNQISAAINKRNIDTSHVDVFKNIACKIAMIQNTEFPKLLKPTHFIIATEHGINEVFNFCFDHFWICRFMQLYKSLRVGVTPIVYPIAVLFLKSQPAS